MNSHRCLNLLELFLGRPHGHELVGTLHLDGRGLGGRAVGDPLQGKREQSEEHIGKGQHQKQRLIARSPLPRCASLLPMNHCPRSVQEEGERYKKKKN